MMVLLKLDGFVINQLQVTEPNTEVSCFWFLYSSDQIFPAKKCPCDERIASYHEIKFRALAHSG